MSILKAVSLKRSSKRNDADFHIVTLTVAMKTSGCIWPNFKLIEAFMHALITCIYEKNPITRGPMVL